MKIVFAGTPIFAQSILSDILQAGHEVEAVLTQPDRPAGRGMKQMASAVKVEALAHSIAVFQPERLRPSKNSNDEVAVETIGEYQRILEKLAPDLIIVVAYGLIIPPWLLSLPKLGCINVHASLLPRWRGAAPIQRAIEAGDKATGVTIMQMDEGLDTGDILLMEQIAIPTHMNTEQLHDELAILGSKLLLEVLADVSSYQKNAISQKTDGVTYADKIQKDEAILHWDMPAEAILQKIKAFNPFPGVSLPIGLERFKVWDAKIAEDFASSRSLPGTIVAQSPEGIFVQSKTGVLQITVIQKAGSKRMSVKDFLLGTKIL